LAYVLAVSRDHVITTPAGRRRADALAAVLPKGAWQRVSCGYGAKGRRFYDWALIATSRPEISLLIPTSSTPANGHDGATVTSNEPATATTSDNNYKITKCGWSTS